MTIDWRGVFPAVTTQLTAAGEIDFAATRACVERLIGAGVKGLVMLGMVGENGVMTPEEKRAVLQAGKEAAAGRVPVLGGVAELTTLAACRYAAECAKLGLDGLMVFPPIGYKSDAAETVRFYRDIAAAGPLPILIYNNPAAYGVDVTPEMLPEMAESPTIVAIKEESYDVRRVTDIIARTGERITVICGVDDLLLESVVLGAVGWVSGMANVYAKESVTILAHALAGRWDEARRLYRILTPIYHLDTRVKLVQYIKLAGQLNGVGREFVRPPRQPLAGEERALTERLVRETNAALARL
jgi:4-hydroxy-tetrahydrodipicolinate synthase